MGCVSRQEAKLGQNLSWGLPALWEPIVLSTAPPYLGLDQSCPSFLPGAWSPADSCNPRGLPVWPAPYGTPATEALLPASLPWGPGQGREVPCRPLLPVQGPPEPLGETVATPRSDPFPADLFSSVRGQMVGRAGAGHPPLLLVLGQL